VSAGRLTGDDLGALPPFPELTIAGAALWP